MAHVLLFQTERLDVRRFSPDDAEAVFRVYRDPDVWRWLGGGEPYADIERAQASIRRYIEGYADPAGLGYWAVVVRNTNEFIGTVLLLHLEQGPEIELGYHFGTFAWGKGYATEAGRGAIQYGFNELDLAQICGVVFPENVASQRVLEKAGMTYRGMRLTFGFNLMYYTIGRDSSQTR